jgi:hypothetical protein
MVSLLRFLLIMVVMAGTAQADGIYRSYRQASLARVLFELAAAAHQDVVIGDDVRGVVDLELKGDDPQQVLKNLVKVHRAHVEDVQGIWVVVSGPETKGPTAVTGLPDPIAKRQISLGLHWILSSTLLSLLARELDTTVLSPESHSARLTAALSNRPAPAALAAIARAMRCEIVVHGRLVTFVPVSQTGSGSASGTH